MNPLEKYAPIFIGGATVLILGILNPRFLQEKRGGRYSGFPSYFWLAIISVAVALFFQAFNPIEQICSRL